MQSWRLKSPVGHVNILKKVRINGTWKLVPVVVELNGRLKDKVRIGDRIEVHPEGTYYVEWWEQNRRKRKSIPYRDRVLDIARRKAFEREATKAGLQIVSETQDKADNPSKKTRLDLGIRTFLEDIEPPQREPKTYSAYKYCLNLFQSDCSKSYIQDVERQDLLQFIRNQYERGCGARTAYNRVNIVTQFLKLSGVTGLLHRRDWPEYVEAIRETYDGDELNALFAACNPAERVRYLFFLLTGERDKEVRFTTWRDIDFRRGTVCVTTKPQLGFKPKNKEEREIPVPSSLLVALKVHKDSQQVPNSNNLVFPTTTGRPDKNFEIKLKQIAYRAGLNCGSCTTQHGNRCAEGAFCGNWFLHKFRHTFAKINLEGNVCSLRTLQDWLGHKNLASTMIYLKYIGGREIHERVNNSELAAFAIPYVK